MSRLNPEKFSVRILHVMGRFHVMVGNIDLMKAAGYICFEYILLPLAFYLGMRSF